ncbi:arabinosyltransferase C-terminal domain-containing protein [Nocardia arthritidis]|uniref:Arabinosyltransferase C-terminal domain-containing protein n=1 Tax=Nocardia arthritidis TaxID=228602 RepID=A0A6G9YUM6_9NOCA|nr:hypothetical protein F5544_31355 [Nocardia arthritidis]
MVRGSELPRDQRKSQLCSDGVVTAGQRVEIEFGRSHSDGSVQSIDRIVPDDIGPDAVGPDPARRNLRASQMHIEHYFSYLKHSL